jgi:hypothetical protein
MFGLLGLHKSLIEFYASKAETKENFSKEQTKIQLSGNKTTNYSKQ